MLRFAALVLAALVLACIVPQLAAAMPTPTPSPVPADIQRVIDIASTPDTQDASPVNGRDWSIFNHRSAGMFVLLWGLTGLIAGLLWPRKTWFRFVPGLVLLGLAEFLFLRNDPKAWPTGPIGFWISFHDPATFQHRIFVLLVIALGIVELLRAADLLPPLLRIFALPALAVFGAVLLFFHQHGGIAALQTMQAMPQGNGSMAGMPGGQNMAASMNIIKGEHLWFSLIGFGFAVAKLLGDGGVLKGRLGATLWTVFAIALGAYMLWYTE